MARNDTFSINGREYPITDHTYDVVVVGAGGALFPHPGNPSRASSRSPASMRRRLQRGPLFLAR